MEKKKREIKKVKGWKIKNNRYMGIFLRTGHI